MENRESLINALPKLSFLFGVSDIWDFTSHLVLLCHLCDLVSPHSVFGILELRVVLNLLNVKQYFADEINLLVISGEPRNSDWLRLGEEDSCLLQLLFGLLEVEIFVVGLERDLQSVLCGVSSFIVFAVSPEICEVDSLGGKHQANFG